MGVLWCRWFSLIPLHLRRIICWRLGKKDYLSNMVSWDALRLTAKIKIMCFEHSLLSDTSFPRVSSVAGCSFWSPCISGGSVAGGWGRRIGTQIGRLETALGFTYKKEELKWHKTVNFTNILSRVSSLLIFSYVKAVAMCKQYESYTLPGKSL